MERVQESNEAVNYYSPMVDVIPTKKSNEGTNQNQEQNAAYTPPPPPTIELSPIDQSNSAATGGGLLLENSVEHTEAIRVPASSTAAIMPIGTADASGIVSSSSSVSSCYTIDYVDYAYRFRPLLYLHLQAGLVGILTGCSVCFFKLSINALQKWLYTSIPTPMLIPAIGGLLVAIIALLGPFSPGLQGIIERIDQLSSSTNNRSWSQILGLSTGFKSLRKVLAAVATLGTGCSLGPEGPAVEIGMNLSRFLLCLDWFPQMYSSSNAGTERRDLNRLLLVCGAAAGVSAGFNAPLTGTFFALEVVQGAFSSMHQQTGDCAGYPTTSSSPISPVLITTSGNGNIGAVLVASVLAGLISTALLQEDILILRITDDQLGDFKLLEMPLFVVLGMACGGVAFLFRQVTRFCQFLFDQLDKLPSVLGSGYFFDQLETSLPSVAKPILGGLFCGLVGWKFPPVLFHGYYTLNLLLGNQELPESWMALLLIMKMITTAVSAGSGLVGGTFAPSLFLGAMVGGSFHGLLEGLVGGDQSSVGSWLSSQPIYAVIGAASLLAALFQAPLTACLLLFELTQDYNAMLALMASCSIASVFGRVLESKRRRREQRLRRKREEEDRQKEIRRDMEIYQMEISCCNESTELD